MSKFRIGLIAAIVIVAIVGWEVAASYLLHVMGQILGRIDYQYVAWIHFVRMYDTDKWLKLFLIGSAVVPAIILTLISVAIIRVIWLGSLKNELKDTNNHGRARWMTMKEAKDI